MNTPRTISAIILGLILIAGISGLVWATWFSDDGDSNQNVESVAVTIPSGEDLADVIPDAAPTEQVEEPAPTEPFINSTAQVPFVAQAPFGDWEDPRQQDACEEISVAMAMAWVNGEELSPQRALDLIINMSAFELDTYGSYTDTSAQDTNSRLLQEFYNYDRAQLVTDATKQTIIDALANGSIVIAPTNGQALGNPNFTAPGPERHMLVVIGYDEATQQFITNDPGTRSGKGYRYNEDVFEAAIRNYTTGNHAPIQGVEKTVIIVTK